jgi:hypothetical protein
MHHTDTPFTDETFTGIPACPDWCDQDERHGGYEHLTGSTAAACGHDRNMGTFTYIQTEDVANIGESVRRRVPWIVVSVREDDKLDAEGARKIAAELLATADKLDEITAATS